MSFKGVFVSRIKIEISICHTVTSKFTALFFFSIAFIPLLAVLFIPDIYICVQLFHLSFLQGRQQGSHFKQQNHRKPLILLLILFLNLIYLASLLSSFRRSHLETGEVYQNNPFPSSSKSVSDSALGHDFC